MKKLILWAAGTFFAVLMVLVAPHVRLGYLSAKYESTLVPYIQATIPKISSWNPSIFKKYTSPDVWASVSDSEIEILLGLFSRLGYLRSLGDPRLEEVSSLEDADGTVANLTTYTVPAQYSEGEAIITVSIKVRGDSFEVYGIRFSSDALL